MKELIDFIAAGEGLKLRAYECPAGEWTIGFGNTYYADGRRVKSGDRITIDEAYQLAEFIVLQFSIFVKSVLKKPVNKNQFAALVSMCYTTGRERFSKSIILKMVNVSPNDPAIRAQFLRSFITANGVESKGLINRRQSEANRYFSKIN